MGRVPRYCIVAWDETALGQPMRLFGDISCIILALCWYSYVSNRSLVERTNRCVHLGEVCRETLFDVSFVLTGKGRPRSSRSLCAERDEAQDMNRLVVQNSLKTPTTKRLGQVRGALSFVGMVAQPSFNTSRPVLQNTARYHMHLFFQWPTCPYDPNVDVFVGCQCLHPALVPLLSIPRILER